MIDWHVKMKAVCVADDWKCGPFTWSIDGKSVTYLYPESAPLPQQPQRALLICSECGLLNPAERSADQPDRMIACCVCGITTVVSSPDLRLVKGAPEAHQGQTQADSRVGVSSVGGVIFERPRLRLPWPKRRSESESDSGLYVNPLDHEQTK